MVMSRRCGPQPVGGDHVGAQEDDHDQTGREEEQDAGGDLLGVDRGETDGSIPEDVGPDRGEREKHRDEDHKDHDHG
jgi:hypothetical protein